MKEGSSNGSDPTGVGPAGRPIASPGWFFFRCGLGLIVCILLGFGGRALVQGEELAPDASVLLPHIACISGWYLLFALQAYWIASAPPGLARQKRRVLHKRVGYASLLLAAGLLVTGFPVTAANFRLKGDAPLVFFNVLNLTQFAVLFTWAVCRVKDPALHKRLMLFASLAMMPPALVRMVQAVGLPEPVTVLLIVGWWVPILLHDRATRGRVHRGTWIGITAIGIGLVVGGPIGFSDGWRDLVVRWCGEPLPLPGG